MGQRNKEWLASLSDRALTDEIRYGRVLAEDASGHRNHHTRELAEAREELEQRKVASR